MESQNGNEETQSYKRYCWNNAGKVERLIPINSASGYDHLKGNATMAIALCRLLLTTLTAISGSL
jgi:hypothetical protein